MNEENKYLKTRADRDIIEDSDYCQTRDMMNAIVGELLLTKEKIDDLMNSSGWDSAYFPVDITLRVKFGYITVEVCDGWEAIEP